jgi:hypothetical protein
VKRIEIKRTVIMRSPSGTVRFFVLAGSTAIALAVPAFAEEKSGKVEIKEDVIIIHPGSKISKSDTAALNEVLRKYDKSLYKIETYRSGKSKKKLGELSDMFIDQTVASELASAKESGESDRSIQVISPNGPQGPAMVPVNPQRPSSPMPAGPQMQSPMPTGPQMQSPMPAGPQMSPSSPVPSGPQMVPTGPQRSPSSPTNPQHAPTPAKPADAKAYKQLIERLKPILEKYSK